MRILWLSLFFCKLQHFRPVSISAIVDVSNRDQGRQRPFITISPSLKGSVQHTTIRVRQIFSQSQFIGDAILTPDWSNRCRCTKTLLTFSEQRATKWREANPTSKANEKKKGKDACGERCVRMICAHHRRRFCSEAPHSGVPQRRPPAGVPAWLCVRSAARPRDTSSRHEHFLF